VDLAGYEDEEEVAIAVRDVAPPTVTVISPVPPGPFFSNVPVDIVVELSDADTPTDQLRVRVVDSLMGQLDLPDAPGPDGRYTAQHLITAGFHTLQVFATDPEGAEGSDIVHVAVQDPNEAPTCRWEEPVDSAAFLPFAPVTFRLAALDDVVAPEYLTWVLRSDRDGQIGAGNGQRSGFVEAEVDDLTLGVHQVSFELTDPFGGVGVCDRTVYVDTPPFMVIRTPVNLQRVPRGEQVVVSGQVEDGLTPLDEVIIRMRSDREGLRWTQSPLPDGSFAVATSLQPGAHRVTVEAEDHLGLVSTVEIQVIME
jgi:hypothetical protein